MIHKYTVFQQKKYRMSSRGWQANSFINNPLWHVQDVNIFEVLGRGRCGFNCSIQSGATLDLDIIAWGLTEMLLLAWESWGCLSARRIKNSPQKILGHGRALHRWLWPDGQARGSTREHKWNATPCVGERLSWTPMSAVLEEFSAQTRQCLHERGRKFQRNFLFWYPLKTNKQKTPENFEHILGWVRPNSESRGLLVSEGQLGLS